MIASRDQLITHASEYFGLSLSSLQNHAATGMPGRARLACILWFHQCGMTFEEIAASLQLTVTTVREHLGDLSSRVPQACQLPAVSALAMDLHAAWERGAPGGSVARWVCAAVAEEYCVPNSTIMSRDRDPLVVEARRCMIGVLRKLGFTPSEIARYIDRDHSTVLHHYERIDAALLRDDIHVAIARVRARVLAEHPVLRVGEESADQRGIERALYGSLVPLLPRTTRLDVCSYLWREILGLVWPRKVESPVQGFRTLVARVDVRETVLGLLCAYARVPLANLLAARIASVQR